MSIPDRSRADDSVFIIAEAGVNHNGDSDMAHRLVDAAADAGADAVKFQTFKGEALAARSAPKARYQTVTTDKAESQLAMLKRLELPHPLHYALIEHCEQRNITFLSTPFDMVSLSFLMQDLELPLIKIPSGEITNGPLLLAAARFGRDTILSTGMSTLDEIEDALKVLAFGYTQNSGAVPSAQGLSEAFNSADGQQALTEHVDLLHCVTEYPAPVADTNLRAMDTMREAFGLPVGMSDHSAGIVIPIAAAARGASIIEKHFTLDTTLPGPDHAASLEPLALSNMVAAIREVELAMGDGRKRPGQSEQKNMEIARKSLVATKTVTQGERFDEQSLGVKRPGSGISPMDYWKWVGKPAPRNFDPDDLVSED